MDHFEITDKTGYSTSWIFLFLLLLAGIVLWYYVSSYAAVLIGLVGAAIAALSWRKGKKKIGDHVEFTNQGIIFCQSGESSCVSFKEIKLVTENKPFLSKPFYEIKTAHNTRRLQPEEYENEDILREKLLANFLRFNCKIEKK